MLTYTQASKINARHKMFFYAIDLLTTNRSKSCCVERSYVRKVLDYFLSLDESKEKEEASKIDINYVKSWESLHDSCVGTKRPEDLVVCYLSGPEPQNDFKELISLGIHPQNIWAFEVDRNTYDAALLNFGNEYPQPKLVKHSIEHFFIHTPKKFDIVYIDACGTIASEQQCLRIIATLCKYHRLNSPGIIVTNFACPDLSKESILEEYSELIAEYLLYKHNPDAIINNFSPTITSDLFNELKCKIKMDFSEYYGELITNSIIDIAALAVPIQRFVNSSYIKSIVKELPQKLSIEINEDGLNGINNNSLYKFFYLVKLLEHHNGGSPNQKRIKAFIKGFSGIENMQKDLFEGLSIFYKIKNDKLFLRSDILEIETSFDTLVDMYQFLDKPNIGLLLDVIINQFAYPLHYNSNAIRRYNYKAKHMEMFMDVIVLDECRYIYEWLPTLDQLKHAIKNVSWQYVFRFALDGLVKQRIKYNNEYFFQGSVISKEVLGFEFKSISDREEID